MEKEEWERWKGRVSGEFEWTIQEAASKEGRRGRAKGVFGWGLEED